MTPPPGRVLLDTNLLLLWLVSRTDESLLKSFKRVQDFTPADLHKLNALILPYRQLVTTPHVLSETSNFVDQAPPWRRAALLSQFKAFIRDVAEVYRSGAALIEHKEFNALGLTDTALLELSAGTVVMTVDHKLAGKIEGMGGNVLNFNHYRSSLLKIRPPD